MIALHEYVCRGCQSTLGQWFPQCPKCRAWSTIKAQPTPEEIRRRAGAALVPQPAMPAATESSVYSSIDISAAEPPRTVSGEIDRAPEFAPPEPVRITDVKDEDLVRIMTGLEPFDRVLGGGLVADSAILIGGDPGSGKSTMCIQAIAGVGERVLYATGEETIAQVTMRARRVGAAHPEIWIVPSNDTDEIIEHARKIRPSILVVDSANVIACAGIGGVAGSISQIKESTSRLARFAKREHVILIMIAHVTKDGAIAGPNTLNHLVDVVLLLECAEFGQRRFLRATKNRMGSTQEVGTFEMCADGMICVEPGAGDVPFAIVNEERIEVGAPEVAMQDEVSEAIDVLAAVPEEIR